ncbi:MAG TPA: ATP-binding protein [Vicinamibacterales bacterium]|nr:ATP-binding protein [Vicinamibacterales bacterium]
MIYESVAARPTVLAFDDSGTNLSRLSSALQDEGYDVVVASSERDVPDLLQARAVDCLVLPMSAATLRNRLGTPHVPLLVTLASADDALATRALDEGADDCAPVSGDLAVLKARVRALLRRSRTDAKHRSTLADTIERKDKELVSLNYAISHDLRAPLRAIDGFGRILLEECAGALDAKHVNYLQRIGAAARELGVLIDDLLQLSRAGRAELRKGRLDLTDMARRVAGDLQAASTRTVEVIVDDGLVVHADRTLMRIALEHLIGNSWKFTGPSPAARIECRAERSGDQPAFVVRDNGVGFDSARAGKLFQPFQRLHAAAEFQGAGIGLAVVQKIMDRHGGRVWAEGRPGQGASFYFTLPPGPGDPR